MSGDDGGDGGGGDGDNSEEKLLPSFMDWQGSVAETLRVACGMQSPTQLVEHALEFPLEVESEIGPVSEI